MRAGLRCAAAVLACIATVATAQEPWTFLVAGEYRVGNGPARPGKGWLALVQEQGRWRLVPATLTATVRDDIVEIGGDREDALGYFRGEGIRAGTVPTPSGVDLSNPNGRPFAFGGKSYSLHMWKEPLELPNDDGSVRRERHGALYVQGPEGRRRLGWAGDGPIDDTVSVQWMGDLDRDGRLDLLVYHSSEKGGVPCLYLSRRASGQALFGEAICPAALGC